MSSGWIAGPLLSAAATGPTPTASNNYTLLGDLVDSVIAVNLPLARSR